MAKHTGHTITSDSALGAANIQRSLRFNSADTTYLNRTPSSSSNRKTWTWSSWVKRTLDSGGTNRYIFMAGQTDGNDNVSHLSFNNNNHFTLLEVTGSFIYRIQTTGLFRDFSSWMHVVATFDTTQSTASDRIKLYVNGVQETDLAQNTYPSQNHDSYFNHTVLHNIGRYNNGSTQWYQGYMAEINFIDGYAYDPSYFGFTDPQTGIWMPKRYEGTYGTNGFYLDFSDNSSTAALGIDKSPNGNDWTTNNFSVSAGDGNDSVIDTPTNNFCTLNSLDNSGNEPSNGNLQGGTAGTSGWRHTRSTFALPSTGKWYWEYKIPNTATDGSNGHMMGIAYSNLGFTQDINSNSTGLYGRQDRGKYNNSSSDPVTDNHFSTPSNNDIFQFAYNADSQTLFTGRNNTWELSANPVTGANPNWTGVASGGFPMAGSYGSSRYVILNFGQQGFSYTPPTGYRALNSKNLPPKDSTIIRPQRHFDIVTYTGNGSYTGQSITSLEFQPDLIWFKSRSHARNHVMNDSVRGRRQGVYPDVVDSEFTDDTDKGLLSFDPNGFTVGQPQNASSHNNNGESIVAWCWKAGGTAVTNNDGNNTSQVSANTEAGFSILTYTGNGTDNSNVTMGHGLGKAPNCVIIKNRTSSKEFVMWITGTGGSATDNQKNLQLNATASAGQNSDQFRYADATTIQVRSTDSTNGKINKNGDNYVAYCWADIPGYSKFGNYTGNGSYDGPFINTGFSPAFLMIKNADNSSGYWVMLDSKRRTFNQNGPSSSLYADDNSAENTFGNATGIDFLSNGFKIRDELSYINGSGNNMVYMCFAEAPETTPFDTFPNAR